MEAGLEGQSVDEKEGKRELEEKWEKGHKGESWRRRNERK